MQKWWWTLVGEWRSSISSLPHSMANFRKFSCLTMGMPLPSRRINGGWECSWCRGPIGLLTSVDKISCVCTEGGVLSGSLLLGEGGRGMFCLPPILLPPSRCETLQDICNLTGEVVKIMYFL